MSLSTVRGYFRTKMDALVYQEWTDGFNFDNIPSTLLNKAYHIQSGTITGLRNNQNDQETSQIVTIRSFYKGFRDPASAIDTAVSETELIIKAMCAPTSRLATTGLTNVIFQDATLEPNSLSNDNIVKATLQFSVFVIIGF